MDNFDVLWEITATLISLPTPNSLYCFLAAHPMAFCLFTVHGFAPLSRRIDDLEQKIFARLEIIFTNTIGAISKSEDTIRAADMLLATSVTANHTEIARVCLLQSLLQGTTTQRRAEELMKVMAAVQPVLEGTSNRVQSRNPIFRREFAGELKRLTEWRSFMERLYDSASGHSETGFTPLKTSWDITDMISRDIQNQGSMKFEILWRRRFFGLDAKLRRSARIEKMRIEKGMNIKETEEQAEE